MPESTNRTSTPALPTLRHRVSVATRPRSVGPTREVPPGMARRNRHGRRLRPICQCPAQRTEGVDYNQRIKEEDEIETQYYR
jgi:hypothetical protein